jgi:hypothetical protein
MDFSVILVLPFAAIVTFITLIGARLLARPTHFRTHICPYFHRLAGACDHWLLAILSRGTRSLGSVWNGHWEISGVVGAFYLPSFSRQLKGAMGL